jgi:phosphoribosylformimino-5-aminoimidazole carboxamide ribotide isomerase
MQIIPAIDIIEGKCVRLSKGDYAQKTIYNSNPIEVAKQFEAAGLNRLHLVDLDGAKAGSIQNIKVLDQIANATSLNIDFSGGISTTAQLIDVWNAGAAYASIGSVAVKNESLLTEWIQNYGAQKFILGADVMGENLAIKGWTEKTTISVFDFIEKYINKGIEQFFCTDISKDGQLQGPNLTLYKNILTQFSTIQFIASGGVAKLSDLHDLKNIGCAAAIVGKAIYENKIALNELSFFN